MPIIPNIIKNLIKRFSLIRNALYKTTSEIFTITDVIAILNISISKSQFFTYKKRKLKYFYHSYNNNRLTERAIEIPLIGYYLEKTGIRKCLEIGNVSNHYYSFFQNLIDNKVVIDKYEKGWDVINLDIKDFIPNNKFDFIFSVSTFEHMDSDSGRNPEYIKGKSKFGTYAADNIYHVCHNILNDNGYFVITAPIGYAHEWDQTVFTMNILDKAKLNVKSININYYRKISEIEWKETNISEVTSAKVGFPFKGVNALSIVEIIK